MAEYPNVEISVDNFSPTKLQQKLLKLIDDDEVKIGVNKIIGERANNYVPMKTGALRESMQVTPDAISWGSGLEYGHYQYEGVVYGLNKPLTIQFTDDQNGTNVMITGWKTPAGMVKYPTDRELGVPGEYMGWTFGYTTPGTRHHWIDEMMTHDRRGMMNQITAYLKREAKKRNL